MCNVGVGKHATRKINTADRIGGVTRVLAVTLVPSGCTFHEMLWHCDEKNKAWRSFIDVPKAMMYLLTLSTGKTVALDEFTPDVLCRVATVGVQSWMFWA